MREKEPSYVSEAAHYYSKGSSALKDTSGGSFHQEIYTQIGYTYDDYLKLELPDGKRVEIIDGIIYDMSAPTLRHQDIVGSVYFIFKLFIKNNKGNCRVYAAPVDVRLEYDTTDMSVVQPDVFVIFDRSKAEDGKAIKGAPDFILEVLSPSSRKIDMNLKMQKYRETGVREYWIVDYDAGIVIKNVFIQKRTPGTGSSQDPKAGEWSRMYTIKDQIPVEIYQRDLVIDFNEVCEYVET